MLPPVQARQPGTSAQLRVQLARLRTVFAGRETGAVRTHLTPITDGQVMVTGTTLPPLRTPFVRLTSGLFVPAAAAPQPLDDTLCWISADELFGAAPSEALTRDWLQQLSFTDVLGFIAATLAGYRNPRIDVRQTDRDFAEKQLANEALLRARNLLRDPSRRLVVPQALYSLAKLAARDSGTTTSPDAEPQMLVLTYFGALQVLDDATDHLDEGDEEVVVDTAVGELSQFALISQYFNRPGDEVHLMARLVRQWLELPRERADAAGVVDLEREFAAVTGSSVRDVTITAILLWTATLQGLPQVRLDYFTALGWTDQRLQAALGVYTADLPTLRRALRTELDAHGPVWGFSSLERYPVARLDDGSLLVLDVQLLVRRIFGGLLGFDVIDALKARGDTAGAKRAAQIQAYLQHLGEAYALEVLHSLVGSGEACPRVFDEATLLTAYRQRGRRIADAAVDYGDAWVVVEITTSRLTRDTVAGADMEALSRDLDKLVDKVEQLDHTIAALRADPSRLTGAPSGPTRRFFPLLVVAEGFPVNPVSVELLRNRVRQRGLLTEANIGPLEVVDTVELELLEGLAESGGPGLRDVLAGKEHATLFRDSLRGYVMRECRYDFARSRRLAGLVDKAWKPAREALPPQALSP
ncbi:hypothetical protein IN07_01300 [Modestobacter caceresii]|uniref:Uncharacterized protein n=1 Tax=Modestobacter caceresii TaxID=1522368 RepID=A0A098YFR5_9ACTN|nr:hypothetical protein IN07_01300 [Modestobacter caceresii]